MVLSARLNVPPVELVDAITTVCRNDVCAPANVHVDRSSEGDRSGPPSDVYVYLQPPLYGSGRLVDEGDGWSRLDVGVDAFGEEAEDGDRYRLTIVDRTGRTLLDVERTPTYESYEPNGPGCGVCRGGTIALYAESATGLSCSAHTCNAGLVAHKTFRLGPDTPKNATLVMCRNDRCADPREFTIRDTAGSYGSNHYFYGALRGALDIRYVSKSTTDVTVTIRGETALLVDGDRYRVLITSVDTGETLMSVDETITYEADYPNGETCDVQPCRTKRLEVQ